MPDTTDTTAYDEMRQAFPPGTRVTIPGVTLPGASPERHLADAPRTVLDAADYVTASGVSLVGIYPRGNVLVADPQGWEARVVDGKPDAGTSVNLWWVGADGVRVQMPQDSPVALTDAEMGDLLTLVRAGDVAGVMTAYRQAKEHHHAACQQRDALASQVDDLKAQVEKANAMVAEAHEARDTAQARYGTTYREFQAFRNTVRDVAIRTQEAQGWCVPGLNEVLEELGLEVKATEWEVEVEVTARQTVTVTVTALDEDDAKEKITDGEVDLPLEGGAHAWDWQTTDDLEFLDVSQA